MFKKSILETIKQRHSWRDYSDQTVEPEKIEMLKKAFNDLQPPFGNKSFLDILAIPADEINKFTTYGFIKGAKMFIIGKTVKTPMCWEDYGWILEHIILLATELGLCNCWLGGTFSRKNFEDKLDLAPDEIIPAIASIGYPTETRSLRDRAIRWVAGSHRRRPWNSLFFEQDFNTPLPEDAGIYTSALAMLRLAPSASNRQPWRVIKKGDAFHFYLQRTPGYGSAFGVDLQGIDMGIAMSHFELTLKEQGITGKWQTENPNLPNLSLTPEYRVSWIKN